MPSEKILEEKISFVQELSEKIGRAASGVVVQYEGITVADDTALRRKLREAGVEYAVVKNTMLQRAAKAQNLDALDGVLKGTTALALSYEDPLVPAKILHEYAEKSKVLKIKAGFIEGRVVGTADVAELAKMPPREELIARVLAGFNSPISNFVGVLNANLRGLVVALNAIAEQKSA